MEEQHPTMSEAALRAALGRLLGRPVRELLPLGSGSDHAAYLLDGSLVARVPLDPPSGGIRDLGRQARLLDLVAEVVPVEVPQVVALDEESSLLVTTNVPGVPLLDVPHVAGALPVEPLAETMRALVAATDRAAALGLAAPDPHPLAAYRQEAVEDLAAVAGALSSAQRDTASERLSGPLPPEGASALLCHNDLGAEHLMVDPREPRLLGVIDWSDAALTDVARDLGRICRDLGPGPAHAVVARLGDGHDPHLWDRAVLHARCSLIEDLAFGLEHDERYAAAALRSFDRTFADDAMPRTGPGDR